MLPVAEACGVRLALHPDDPPLTEFIGQRQIITSNEALQRVVALAPSPAKSLWMTGPPERTRVHAVS